LANARALAGVVNEALNISQEYRGNYMMPLPPSRLQGDETPRAGPDRAPIRSALRQALEKQRLVAARLAEILHLDSGIELVPEAAELLPVTLIETNAPSIRW